MSGMDRCNLFHGLEGNVNKVIILTILLIVALSSLNAIKH